MNAAPLPHSALTKTALHAAHEAMGAKMGAFAGFDMPLYYAAGVMAEHLWTREHAGLFDVSHMGQVILEGPGVVKYLEKLTPSAFSSLPHGVAKYTVLTNAEGGVIDDLIVTRLADDKFYAVLNAGCKDKDLAWIRRHLPADVTLRILQDRALLALQGPDAESVLREVLDVDASALGYMRMIATGPYYISRLGYTGEDGFEISLPVPQAEIVWNRLLEDARVKPVGLAARDTLRLEMQYCLYGHELDETISPLEADLRWVMRKSAPVCFGAARLAHELEQGTARKRIGVQLLDKGVAREGAAIVDAQGRQIGTLTSGGFSPTLQTAIGMGYVAPALAVDGAEIGIQVRDRILKAKIVLQPFVSAKTKTVAKAA